MCLGRKRHVYDGNTHMRFVKSSFLGAVFCFTLCDHDRLQKRIKISETGGYV